MGHEDDAPTEDAHAARVTEVAMRCGDLIVSGEAPRRHHDLISEINTRGWGDTGRWEQGFLDADGAFLNRREAAQRALWAGQVKHLAHMELFSEDLW